MKWLYSAFGPWEKANYDFFPVTFFVKIYRYVTHGYCFKNNSKYLIDINNVDIDKILISNKISFGSKGFQCFIGYKDDNRIKRLRMVLPRISRYGKRFDKTKCMLFLINDN